MIDNVNNAVISSYFGPSYNDYAAQLSGLSVVLFREVNNFSEVNELYFACISFQLPG